LTVVPVLLFANLLLGIYVNLSIWYKLTDRTLMGAWVSLIGAGITVGVLLTLIPRYGYAGAAWAHLACYSAMVVISYVLGRRYYPVPYDLKRVFGYLVLGLALYALSRLMVGGMGWGALPVGFSLLALFLALVFLIDGRTLIRRPQV
uniref:lipopolysaccharide biosynthesis protein n=1 Tax=uncultured Thiodictyon sp. TaxID=1846217 RepID=UPI0025F9FB61